MKRGPSRVTALEIPDLPRNPMADLLLSCRDRASFCSSVWSSWTGAPFDLHLVAEVWNHGIFVSWMFIFEDGVVGAHCAMVLSQSRQLAAIVKAHLPYTTGPAQVPTIYKESSKKCFI